MGHAPGIHGAHRRFPSPRPSLRPGVGSAIYDPCNTEFGSFNPKKAGRSVVPPCPAAILRAPRGKKPSRTSRLLFANGWKSKRRNPGSIKWRKSSSLFEPCPSRQASATRPPSGSENKSPGMAPKQQNVKPKVLWIDDDEIVAEFAKRLHAFIEVEHAELLSTGLDRLSKGGIEVILLDLNLP